MIPFENTDDSYKSKMSAYYSEWSSMGDKFSDVGNAIKNFLTGVEDSIEGTVKGLLTLVADLGILYVYSECRGGNSDKALGQWFTTEPPESVAKVRIDMAVKPQWIDTITGELTGESVVDTVYAIKIPKGTTVYTGPVGSQGGAYCGGYNIMQTFIKEPWKLDYQVISKSSLK